MWCTAGLDERWDAVGQDLRECSGAVHSSKRRSYGKYSELGGCVAYTRVLLSRCMLDEAAVVTTEIAEPYATAWDILTRDIRATLQNGQFQLVHRAVSLLLPEYYQICSDSPLRSITEWYFRRDGTYLEIDAKLWRGKKPSILEVGILTGQLLTIVSAEPGCLITSIGSSSPNGFRFEKLSASVLSAALERHASSVRESGRRVSIPHCLVEASSRLRQLLAAD